MLLSYLSTKVFSLKSFLLYGNPLDFDRKISVPGLNAVQFDKHNVSPAIKLSYCRGLLVVTISLVTAHTTLTRRQGGVA